MSLALITAANPRVMRESHPSYLTQGKWKVVAPDVTSKLSVRRRSLSDTVESVYSIGDSFDGECLVVIQIVEPAISDSKISVYAEKV